MSKKTFKCADESPAPAPSSDGAGAIALTDSEVWSSDTSDLPSAESVVESLGLTYLGMVDAPAPPEAITVPPALFAKIQHWDRETAAAAARRQEYMELAIDLLGVEREKQAASIDLDTGIVTLTSREEPSA